MEQLEILLKMRDELSKPLTEQQKALRKVNEQIKLVKKTQADQAREAKKQAYEQQKALKEMSAAMGEDLVAAGTAATVAGAALAAVILALGAAAVVATTKFMHLVSVESDWASKTKAAFAVMDRAGGGGKTQLKIVTDIAKAQGADVQDVANTAKELLDAGVRNQRELQQSLQAVTDLQAAGSESSAAHLKDLIKRASSARAGFKGQDTWAGTAMFSASEIQKAGASTEDFYKELSKVKGKTVTQMDLMTFKVRASSKEMIKALTQAVSKRVGPIAEKAWTLERIKNSWSATWQDMVKSVDFAPLYKALRGLIAIFDPLSKSGEANSNILVTVMNKLVKATAWMVRTMTLWILKLEIAFLKAYIVIINKVGRLAVFIKDHMTVVKGVLIGVGLMFALWTVAILAVAAAFIILWAVILIPMLIVIALFAALGVAFEEVITHMKDLKEGAIALGKGLIDGLIAGIKNGIGAVKSAIKELSDATLGAMKAALGIHSPSTAFAKLGKFAAAGFNQGFDGSMGSLSLPSGKIEGGGSKAGAIQLGGIEVNIQGVDKAEKIIPSLIPALTDAIEQILIEYGH